MFSASVAPLSDLDGNIQTVQDELGDRIGEIEINLDLESSISSVVDQDVDNDSRSSRATRSNVRGCY
jgi:hypothetical protein